MAKIDRYIITDDTDASGDPTLVHLFYGAGATAPTNLNISGDVISFSYNLSLAAGQTAIVMHLASQNADQATATATAQWLASQPASLFSGMSTTELSQLVNFNAGVFSATTATLAAGQTNLFLTGTGNINGTGNSAGNAIDPAGPALPPPTRRNGTPPPHGRPCLGLAHIADKRRAETGKTGAPGCTNARIDDAEGTGR